MDAEAFKRVLETMRQAEAAEHAETRRQIDVRTEALRQEIRRIVETLEHVDESLDNAVQRWANSNSLSSAPLLKCKQ
jgi:exonuclease VII small subunit